MEKQKEEVVQKESGDVDNNNNKSQSNQNSSILSILKEYVKEGSIDQDSEAYKTLSHIGSIIEKSIQIEKQASIIKASHIPSENKLDESNHKQSVPNQLMTETTEKDLNNSQPDYYEYFLYDQYQQLVDIIDRQTEQMKDLEQQNRLMNLMLKFQENHLLNYSQSQLKKICLHYLNKKNKYKRKCTQFSEKNQRLRQIASKKR